MNFKYISFFRDKRLCHKERASADELNTLEAEGPYASSSEEAIGLDEQYLAHNYHPLPVVLSRGEGAYVFDANGNKYIDGLAAYSAVNQGHRHPALVKAAQEQLQRGTLYSRAFHNDVLGRWAEYITKIFGYDKVLPANGGVEAVETAMKLARLWGYKKKEVPEDQAEIVSCDDCFHGRTISVVSMSTDPDCYENFGPKTPGLSKVPYNDLEALEAKFKSNSNIVAFLVEPIQGEAGVKIPDQGYLAKVKELCTKYNILFMADEIQTGLGRTGELLACDHEGVRPDVLILGKALSGGLVPMSAVLADSDKMIFEPGQHGSTFGGNPYAARVGFEALKVLRNEGMVENSAKMGEIFRREMEAIRGDIVTAVRGRGLLNAFDINPGGEGRTAWDVCLNLMERGVLAKPTHDNTIRFSPPLVVGKEDIEFSANAIKAAIGKVFS